jgi:hypothetical protein
MTALPNRNVLDGTKLPATTTSEMKTALGSLRDYLSENIGDNSSNPVMSSINGGQLYGFRNLLINGGLQVDNRNSGAAQTLISGVAAYTSDRFYATNVGANGSCQRVYDVTNNKYRQQFTGTAGTTSTVFGQRVESQNSYKTVGKTVALSVEVANTILTSVTWTAYSANAVDNFSTATQIATGTFTGVSATPTRKTASFVVPAAGSNGISVQFSVTNQISGILSFAEVQLEITDSVYPHSTVFEQVAIDTTLLQCYRYLPIWKLSGYAFTGQCTGSTDGRLALPTKIPLRVAATGILISGAVAFSQVGGTGTGSPVFFSSTLDYVLLSMSGCSGLVAGNATMLLASSPATIFGTGCEL